MSWFVFAWIGRPQFVSIETITDPSENRRTLLYCENCAFWVSFRHKSTVSRTQIVPHWHIHLCYGICMQIYYSEREKITWQTSQLYGECARGRHKTTMKCEMCSSTKWTILSCFWLFCPNSWCSTVNFGDYNKFKAKKASYYRKTVSSICQKSMSRKIGKLF